MELQADLADASPLETFLHDLEGDHLLGDDQHGLAVVHGGGDHVGDRLRLAGARGPWTTRLRPARTVPMTSVCDESASTTCTRSAGWKFHVVAIERLFLAKAVDQEALQHLVAEQRAVGPGGGIEILDHQELRERIEAKLETVGIDAPGGLRGDRGAHGGEVVRGVPLLALGHVGQGDVEVGAQALLQRLIGKNSSSRARRSNIDLTLSLTRPTGRSRSGASRGTSDLPSSNQRRSPKGEEQDVDALSLFGRSRVAVER